jgi:hypothetical protein
VGQVEPFVSDSENPKKVAGSRGPLTVSVKDCEAVSCGEEESDAFTVKVNCPACVVVPESDPLDCNVIPVGSVPEVSVQLYGAVPPVAVNGFEYAVPAVALDKDVVVMLSGGGATVRLKDCDAVSCGEEESDAFTVKVNCPA